MMIARSRSNWVLFVLFILLLAGFEARQWHRDDPIPAAPVLRVTEGGFWFGGERWDQGALHNTGKCPEAIFDAPRGKLHECGEPEDGQ
jgi:hypothetical protein